MSVLGTIWLGADLPLIDRYGEKADGVTVTVHAATTLGIHVHLSITYEVIGMKGCSPELEVQLDTAQARALGQKLVRWADHEDERIAKDNQP